jgi:hypothetical protein
MPRVRFEHTTAIFEMARAFLALDPAATVTGAVLGKCRQLSKKRYLDGRIDMQCIRKHE